MNIIFTCGGTAGHINPALALAREFQSRKPDTKILFVGAAGDSMESHLVPQEGYPLQQVDVSSFYRKLNWNGLKHNAKAVRDITHSRRQAVKIIEDFQPDLVVGTGGYASYPVTREAARRGIPTAIHESNAVPGLTTRRLAKYVDRVMLGLDAPKDHYPHPDRVVLTGTPVRPDFFAHTRQQARDFLGFEDDRPLVVSFFGSLGASVMNGYMIRLLHMEEENGHPFRHIHGAGRYYGSLTAALAQDWSKREHPGVELREYIHDMPTVMAAADVVICRSGASTIAELSALGKAAILIPSPNVTGDHQTKNARAASDRGGAVLMEEKDCEPRRLFDTVTDLLGDPQRRRELGRNLSELAPGNAAQRIYEVLTDLVRSKK